MAVYGIKKITTYFINVIEEVRSEYIEFTLLDTAINLRTRNRNTN